MNLLWFGGAMLTLVGLAAVISVGYLGTHREDPRKHYIVTVDAGSSHSEFQLYSWYPTSSNVSTEVEVEPILSQEELACEVEPGISSYNLDPPAAAAALQDCITAVVDALPASKLSSTPVLLRATAGMRVLNENNSTQATAILTAVNNAFIAAGLSTASTSQILPGQLEGAYGWITINYANNTIGFDLPKHAAVATAGALDMGGASTQISYQVASTTTIRPEDTFRMRLFGLDDLVYTHSYLCYGANEASNAYFLSLLAAQEPAAACLPRQAYMNYTQSDLLSLKASYCTKNIAFPTTAGAIVNGSSDGPACMQATNAFVSNSTMGQSQPSLEAGLNFFAFSGYFHVVDYMCTYVDSFNACTRSLNESSWNVSPAGLLQMGQAVCALDLEGLSKSCNNTIKARYLQVYCFQASYFHSVLTLGYGLGSDSKALHFVDVVNDQNMGWTLGAVLSEATFENGRRPPFQASKSAVVAGATLGGLALLAGCVLLLLAYVARRRTEYQNLPS
eukprot:m.104455 g.104455  ORF g.104455 m.104455 type:complete len:506 (-) comp15246_c0_seq2:922-2439(-)